MEDVAHFNVADNDFLHDGAQEAAHGTLHLLNRLVDDAVEVDVDVGVLGDLCGGCGRPYVKADDDGVRDFRQADIGFGDGPDRSVDHFDTDLVGRKVFHGGGHRFNRALGVCLDDDVEVDGFLVAHAFEQGIK